MQTVLDPSKTILTGRGTTALWAALVSLERRGCGVLVPVNVCELVVASILYAGMLPVYYDVDPISGNAELTHIEDTRATNVAACIVVHNYGTPVDLKAIVDWAREKNTFVIEDVCCAIGAAIGDTPVGHFGDAAIYSFGYAKIIEIGDGGAVQAANPRVLLKIREHLDRLPIKTHANEIANYSLLQDLKIVRNTPFALEGKIYENFYSDRMKDMLYLPDGDLDAKIWSRLSELPEVIDRRRAKAELYRTLLTHEMITHRPRINGDVFWRYSFLVPPEIRDKMIDALRDCDIEASRWFPPVYSFFSDGRKSYPGAEKFAGGVVNLWVDDKTSESTIRRGAEFVNSYLDDKNR